MRVEERDLPDVACVGQLASSACLGQRPGAGRCLEAAGQLSGEALPPVGTISFIGQAASET